MTSGHFIVPPSPKSRSVDAVVHCRPKMWLALLLTFGFITVAIGGFALGPEWKGTKIFFAGAAILGTLALRLRFVEKPRTIQFKKWRFEGHPPVIH